MDRSAFALWGSLLLSAGALPLGGCSSHGSAVEQEALTQDAPNPDAAPGAFTLTGTATELPRAEKSSQIIPVANHSTTLEVASPAANEEPPAPPLPAERRSSAKRPKSVVVVRPIQRDTVKPTATPAPVAVANKPAPVAVRPAPVEAMPSLSAAQPSAVVVQPEAAPPAALPAQRRASIRVATRPVEREVAPATEVSRSQLPWARPMVRSVDMDSAMQQATGYTRRAFELAERHAFFSARAEFVESLRMIAQVYDTQQQTGVNTKSLNNGLTALKETADFRVRGTAAAGLDLTHIVAGHRTPVLKDQELSEMTPIVALQRYYSYAQEQLAAAANGEWAGSMALYGLGRITVDGPSVTKAAKLENATQAVVYYQAALLTNEKNFRAANELGVQLAQLGRLEQSRTIFMHCVQIAPNAATWRNLSNVHARLGEREEAAFAQAQAQVAAKMAPAQQTEHNVQWVDATTFGQTTAAQEGLLAPASEAQKGAKPVAPPPATARKPSIWNPFKSTQQR